MLLSAIAQQNSIKQQLTNIAFCVSHLTGVNSINENLEKLFSEPGLVLLYTKFETIQLFLFPLKPETLYKLANLQELTELSLETIDWPVKRFLELISNQNTNLSIFPKLANITLSKQPIQKMVNEDFGQESQKVRKAKCLEIYTQFEEYFEKRKIKLEWC